MLIKIIDEKLVLFLFLFIIKNTGFIGRSVK